jgi:hypothetical protein
MVPCRVVPHVCLQHLLYGLDLARIPKRESLHEPLSIAPNVVVFLVQRKHFRDKFLFAFGATNFVHDSLTVVPYLVVLLVAECGGVEPFDFCAEVSSYAEYDSSAVEPVILLLAYYLSVHASRKLYHTV